MELARSMFAGWTRGDWSSIAWADPEIEFSMEVDAFPDLGAYKGVEEMSLAWTRFLSAWEDFRASEPELIEQGDRVIGLYTIRARGRSSGIEVEQPVAGTFTFRNGKVARIELITREQGLRATDTEA
jgi:ketosteroid isomerase-like protein